MAALWNLLYNPIVRGGLTILAVFLTALSSTCQAALAAPSKIERRIVAAINAARVNVGRKPLRLAKRLGPVARSHSIEMNATGRLVHESADGAPFSERLLRAMPSLQRMGETIAIASDPSQFVSQWLESTPHRRILLDPRLRLIGVGVAAGTYKGADAYWATADFGSRR